MEGARVLALLRATRVGIREARRNASLYGIDGKKLADAIPSTQDYMVRSSLSQNIISVAENLNGVKDKSILSKYPGVFNGIYPLVGQRNILAHQYGHADENIDWSKVWTTIHDTYPRLESEISAAIEELEREEL